MKMRKVILPVGIAALAAGAFGVAMWQYGGTGAEEEAVYKEVTVERGALTVGVTESGSVSIGTLSQEWDFSDSSAGNMQAASGSAMALEVGTVYVATGQAVEEGDPLLKLTEESIADYRETLEDAVADATLSLSTADLNSATQKLEAGYSYSKSVAEGSVAEANYQATIKELEDAVDDAQEAVDESASLIDYYSEQIEEGVDLYESLFKEQENYAKLSAELKAAENAYTTKSVEAEVAYEKAKLSSANAQSQYNVDVQSGSSDVKEAQDALAEAQEALEEFNSYVGEDGVIYAEYSGIVTEVGYAEGDTLSADTDIASFANADEVTLKVSVSEEDISGIAAGDVVDISLTAYEGQTFEGEVQSIDSTASSGSSTVSYNVTVAFTGDTAGIFTDMTGNVTFIEKKVEDVLYVSNKAILNEGTESYVKVKDSEGNVEKVQVVTGFSDGVNVEIVSGLDEGDTVLIEGQVSAG